MAHKKSTVVSIVRNDTDPAEFELIAEHIIQVSNAFDKIKKSKVKQRVIELLLLDACTGINITQIREILNVAPRLKDFFINK